MNAAAPDGRSLGGSMAKNKKNNFRALLCLGEALRRVSIVFWRFL